MLKIVLHVTLYSPEIQGNINYYMLTLAYLDNSKSLITSVQLLDSPTLPENCVAAIPVRLALRAVLMN